MSCQGLKLLPATKPHPSAQAHLFSLVTIASLSCRGATMLRRMRWKAAAPAAWTEKQKEKFVEAALGDDFHPGGAEFLAAGARTKHVHYTHGRHGNPAFVQPDQMTREEFWSHLLKVYAEAYPDPASPTGSILVFGVVAQERYEAQVPGMSEAHKHAPCFTSTPHYWSKVARISREKYKVHLNAVAHRTYAAMYRYARQPTQKKPLSALDAEPWYSHLHPRGGALERLLVSSERSDAMRDRHAGTKRKRERAPDFFALVHEKRLRSALDVQVLAAQDAADGKYALAEWCTRHGHHLQEWVDSAWAVSDAPLRAAALAKTRLDKLKSAASDMPCVCGGAWRSGAERILQANGIAPRDFCVAVCRALHYGAKRGVNVACIGEGGCGKSTLLEPFEQIFVAFEKPQIGSTFPLGGMLASDILLWQDYEHDEKTMRISDLCGLLCGESIGVRLPGQVNRKHRNTAPLFYTGRSEIACQRADKKAESMYNGMIRERFRIFQFATPLPLGERRVDFPQCARCCAAMFSEHADAASAGEAEPSAGAASGGCGDMTPQTVLLLLQDAAELHKGGALSDAEFAAFKAKLLK